MRWLNLKTNNCPKCGYGLKLSLSGKRLVCHKCKFKIRHERKDEINQSII